LYVDRFDDGNESDNRPKRNVEHEDDDGLCTAAKDNHPNHVATATSWMVMELYSMTISL